MQAAARSFQEDPTLRLPSLSLFAPLQPSQTQKHLCLSAGAQGEHEATGGNWMQRCVKGPHHMSPSHHAKTRSAALQGLPLFLPFLLSSECKVQTTVSVLSPLGRLPLAQC